MMIRLSIQHDIIVDFDQHIHKLIRVPHQASARVHGEHIVEVMLIQQVSTTFAHEQAPYEAVISVLGRLGKVQNAPASDKVV